MNIRFLIAGLATIGAAAAAYLLSFDNNPPQVQAEHVAPKPPLALPQAVPPPVAAVAASVQMPTPNAVALPESRQQRLERQAASADPHERFKAYKDVAKCAFMRNVIPALVKNEPGNAANYNLDLFYACDGLTESLIGKRHALIERLVQERHPGAAIEYLSEAPDGTLLDEALKSPNHQNWITKAANYLDEAAKSGDFDSISAASQTFSIIPGREYDSVKYRVAYFEIRKRQKQNSDQEYNMKIDELLKTSVGPAFKLDPAKVAEAAAAGRAFAKTVKP
jgi:hypothetical protein